ncbi:MAG: hypothetical protein EAZ78_09135 [Oscillatoriales cyanobacterium]|uniref:hypothetical protein n=1 Tax=Microcoleus anatoxicus TaxID=2705319 RepID=UPI002971042C|nr:MAG: hypothetical protein EA000_14635 [Oscillatoriales cyanobacterium]TAD96262.1 MAG: hypothetical protein EAZ98_13090 [Oscillatoriales cyanobacterium]TAE05459.1 MAG: hypothetical protein EAZ96_05370 [Oscillatoriales cyanobacterium]TAF04424.1 MAG: hypothetical protein EAZ78_09135 [Oscillatoriales cyanobacterium]TAF43519.1 MAG: hypothetical protein EAZ68_07810 [Oscillatoriales cyanobacterium]
MLTRSQPILNFKFEIGQLFPRLNLRGCEVDKKAVTFHRVTASRTILDFCQQRDRRGQNLY